MERSKAEEGDFLTMLKDAGIAPSDAEEIAASLHAGHWPHARQLLYAQRAKLVNEAHTAQENLYRIDYILNSQKGAHHDF